MEIKIDIKTDERKNNLRVAHIKFDNKDYSFYSNDRTIYHFLMNMIKDLDLKIRESGE